MPHAPGIVKALKIHYSYNCYSLWPHFRLDRYVVDVLLRDLVGHDHSPAAFVVYLFLCGRVAGRRPKETRLSHNQIAQETGLSKSAVQGALRTSIAANSSFPSAATRPIRRRIGSFARGFESLNDDQAVIAARTLFTPSAHNTPACFDSAGSPPTASSITAARNPRSSAADFPAIHSVSADPAAIDAVHPRTLYRTSAARPSSNRTDNRRMSPHAGFATSTVTAGGGSSPTFRGF